MKPLSPVTSVCAAILLLQGCTTPTAQKITDFKRSQAVEKRDAVVRSLPGDSQVRGGADFAESAAKKQSKPTVLRFSSRSWVGAAMLPTNADDKLPPGFSAEYVMNFADGKAPLPFVGGVGPFGPNGGYSGSYSAGCVQQPGHQWWQRQQ